MTDIVTPNVKEASKVPGDVSLKTISDMRSAAESIYKLGPKYVFCIFCKFAFFTLCVLLPYMYAITCLYILILNFCGKCHSGLPVI